MVVAINYYIHITTNTRFSHTPPPSPPQKTDFTADYECTAGVGVVQYAVYHTAPYRTVPYRTIRYDLAARARAFTTTICGVLRVYVGATNVICTLVGDKSRF